MKMPKNSDLKRIVVKVGTKVLTGKGYSLDKAEMERLVAQISQLHRRGIKVVIVSSGAIISGMGLLGLKNRPAALEKLQACAAIGQPHLMQAYDNLFKRHNILTAQVLLTQDDLNDRKRYINAKNTILSLLEQGVIPIVNENDTVLTDEIKFGDNDRLSSLVANLIEADLLVLLSDVDGLCKYDECKKAMGELIPIVKNISSDIKAMAQKGADVFGKGGMVSKIEAANTATSSGLSCIIANGRKENVLVDICEGKSAGTLFISSCAKVAAKKRWFGFSAKSKGKIEVDLGAKEALAKKHKSLLSSGITGVSGDFKKKDIISIVDAHGKEFARGLTNYSSSELERIKGLKTAEIAGVLGRKGEDEVVHRDNLIILQ